MLRRAMIAAACLVACGGSPHAHGFDSSPSPVSAAKDKDGGAPTLRNAGASMPGCSSGAELIYLIDDQGVLHSFDPSRLPSTDAIKTIGTLNCAWSADPNDQKSTPGPNSMAIDRNAVAWVSDDAGNIFKVSTSDASCQPTNFRAGQHGFGKFGMGFSTDTAGGTTDTLYVVGNGSTASSKDSLGLARIDLSTMQLTPLGSFDNGFGGLDAELTGTGDGKLFGFVFDEPSSLIDIEKADARIMSADGVPLNVDLKTDATIDWAFSFWGGVFYLYTADTSKAPFSDVTEYDPKTKTSTEVLSQVGFAIVGAGVSTCAPTEATK
jgi:hypothetical protein